MDPAISLSRQVDLHFATQEGFRLDALKIGCMRYGQMDPTQLRS